MAGELITGDLQVEWADQLWGDGTVLQVAQVQGWDSMPALSSGTVPRPQQHGAYPGALLAQSRIVVMDGTVTADDLAGARRALRSATALRQDEQELVIQLCGEALLAYGRVIARAIPNDGQFAAGTPAVTVTWECSDPRLYELAEQSALSALPAAETGLSFGSPVEVGLSFGSPTEVGLDFGAPGNTGDLTVTNGGDADAHPVIEIRGPVTTPTITLGSLRLEYAITLGATDVLVVDTWAGTVTLGGQSRITTATSRSVPEGAFTIPPGQSVLSFRAAPGSTDPAAQATVRWRSAYL